MLATIKLFKALPIKKRQGVSLQPVELLEKTIPRGFLFSSDVVCEYSNYDELIKLVEEVYGIASSQANETFHKSWRKVKETDMEQLIVEQVAHYLTTYGKRDPEGYLRDKDQQDWGVDNLSEKILDLPDLKLEELYDKDYIYIPSEVLSIPDLEMDELKLVVIKGYTREELKSKLLKLLNSGIALKEDTINDVTDVALFVDVNSKEIESIRNKEVRAILFEYLNLVPQNPTEFLRYVVYVATDETLLIKSKELIDKIKEGKNIKIAKLFKRYEDKCGLEKLAEIFYRFKPIFLAFRTNRALKSAINKIRRLAVDYHKPMPEDYLNLVTAKIKRFGVLDTSRLDRELKKVNIFRKIRLAYALKFRTKDADSILYRIRNGKGYATDFEFVNKTGAKIALETVLDSIVKNISKNVKGKKIYIPDYINYSLPATEKQFTGNFPSGTYIDIPQDMIFGIHWDNVSHNRIDLDLSLVSVSTGKIGWDSRFRTEERDILFSGDITDARPPLGATELFYVKRQLKDSFILFLNYYNYDANIKVPFKIIIAKEKAKNFRENYMLNPNNIVSVVQSEISQKQKILGVLITTTNKSRFYFAETSIGKSITSTNSAISEHSRKYLMNFYHNSIELKDILSKAGALFTDKLSSKSEIMAAKKDCDIDLSPENLEKDSILNLLLKK